MATRVTPSAWNRLSERAREIGFADLGVTSAAALASARATALPGAPASTGLGDWLAAGMHGEMSWMAERAGEREDPRVWFPEARSLLVGLVPYDGPGEPGDGDEPTGRITRFAWGRDYHLVVGKMLVELGRALKLGPQALGDRAVPFRVRLRTECRRLVGNQLQFAPARPDQL